MEEAYINLAAAIVIQARNDYRRALKEDNRGEARRLERFFRSDWGQLLSANRGEVIIQSVREEVKSGKTKNQTVNRAY